MLCVAIGAPYPRPSGQTYTADAVFDIVSSHTDGPDGPDAPDGVFRRPVHREEVDDLDELDELDCIFGVPIAV